MTEMEAVVPGNEAPEEVVAPTKASLKDGDDSGSVVTTTSEEKRVKKGLARRAVSRFICSLALSPSLAASTSFFCFCRNLTQRIHS
jgi:hypothetical protein